MPDVEIESGSGSEKVEIGNAMGGRMDSTGGKDLGSRIRAYSMEMSSMSFSAPARAAIRRNTYQTLEDKST